MRNFESTSRITTVFSSLLELLSIFGTCPIVSNIRPQCYIFQYFQNRCFPSRVVSCENTERAGESFQVGFFTWKKKITWYSYLVLLWSIFCHVTYLSNIGFGIPFPIDAVHFKQSAENDSYGIGTKRNNYVVAGLTAGYVLLHLNLFLSSAQIVTWLNNWDDFQADFDGQFGSKHSVDFNIGKFKILVLISYTLPLMLLWSIHQHGLFNYNYEVNPHHFTLGNLILVWYATMGLVYPYLEDSKTFLMLKTLQVSIVELREAVQISKKHNGASNLDVIIWRKLFLQIRKQIKLCSKCITGRQLMLLADVVFVVSTGLSLAADLIPKGRSIFDQNNFFIITCAYCFCSLLRLYLTVILAEGIYTEEILLTKEFLMVHGETIDNATRLEAEFLYNIIQLNPSVITVGKYIDLDKKLLVNVTVQTLTLFIAMLQTNNINPG